MGNKWEEIDKLVVRAKNDDKDAIYELWCTYRPLVSKIVVKCCRLGDFDDIREDLLNDAYIMFVECVNEYNSEKSYFSYYINLIFKFKVLNVVESKYRQPIIDRKFNVNVDSSVNSVICHKNNTTSRTMLISDDPSPHDILIDKEMHSRLKVALTKLTSRQLQAIRLYYYVGYNQEESAKILKISQPAFSKRLASAVVKLRRILKKYNR